MSTAQTITLAPFAPTARNFRDRTVTVSATATSLLPVVFSIASGPGTINAATGVMGFAGIGATVVNINQAGNGTYAAAAQAQVTVVVPAVKPNEIQARAYSLASVEEGMRLGHLIGALGGSSAIPQFLLDRMEHANADMRTVAGQTLAVAQLVA